MQVHVPLQTGLARETFFDPQHAGDGQAGGRSLTGFAYAPLRPHFWGLPARSVGESAERVLVTVGSGLLAGAGSDAHVLQGVGTGALRMRRFDGPEEFLLSLRTAEVLRRPKSLAYLQSLKWVAQVKEKVR